MAGDIVVGIRLTADGKDLVGSVRLSEAALDKFRRSAKGAGKASTDAARGLDKLGDEAKEVGGQTDKLNRQTKGLAREYNTLRRVVAVVGLALLARSIFRTNVEIERMRGALVTVTGSQKEANEQFDRLLKFATSTPFTLNQSVQAYIKLRLLGIDPTEKRLRSFGNTSAAVGKQLNDFIEAVADASTGEFERLKEFGIKASAQGDKVAFTFQGTTTVVKNSAKAIVGFLEKIGNTTFSTAMEEQMKRLPGLVSNFQDSITKLSLKIGEGGVNEALKEILADFALLATDGQSTAQIIGRQLGAALIFIKDASLFAARNIDLIAAAIAAIIATRAVIFFNTLVIAVKALNFAFLLSPLGLVLAGVAALAAGVALLATRTNEAEKAQKAFNKILSSAGPAKDAALAASKSRSKAYKAETRNLVSLAKAQILVARQRLQDLQGPRRLSEFFNPVLKNIRDVQAQELRRQIGAMEGNLSAFIVNRNPSRFGDGGRTPPGSGGTAGTGGEGGGKKGKKSLLVELRLEAAERERLAAARAMGEKALAREIVQIKIEKALRKAGVSALSAAGQEIARHVTRINELKAAEKAAIETAKKDIAARKEIRAALIAMGTAYEQAIAGAVQWRKEALEGLDQAKAGYEDMAATVDRVFNGMVKKAQEQALRDSRKWAAGASRAFSDYANEAGNAAANTERAIGVTIGSLEDMFARGEVSAKNFFKVIEEELRRFLFRLATSQLFAILGKLFKGFVGGLGGAGSGNDAADNIAQSEIQHRGGIAGAGGAPRRRVPASTFAGARRYHRGNIVGPNEVPVIAKRGEGIFTPRQMDNAGQLISAIAGMSARQAPVTVEIIDQRGAGAPQAEVSQRRGTDGTRAITVMIKAEVNKAFGQGSFDSALRNNFGIARQVTTR